MKREKIYIFTIAFILGLAGGLISYLILPKKSPQNITVYQKESGIPNVQLTRNFNTLELPDFTTPAEKAVNAVVYIKTEFTTTDPMYYFFYGNQGDEPVIKGSGSGVIINPDGYIVTNNHVIENSANITVTLNDKREYPAEIVGTDPSTDLALIKIEADSLPTIPFGNSDDLKVGEWVLAIGNPFNLTSTVTAGIVSAKARDISIMKKQYAIESFIQTDAAVNPGNSGGALINISGQLVGINSAIASPTGSYAGYSFAIPSSIVQKVVADIMKFGNVQRAFLGVKIADVDKNLADKFNLPDLKGVFVSSVTDDGAAKEAGIEAGDVILKFEGIDVTEVSQLLDLIGRYRPGDIVVLTIRRDDKTEDYNVTLKNEKGGTENIVEETKGIFGASFEDLTKEERKYYGLKNGVKVSAIYPGKFLSVGVKRGFIITKINNQTIETVEDVEKILKNVKGGVYIEGYDPRTGSNQYYAFSSE